MAHDHHSTTPPELSPDYSAYLERRRLDIKQVLEAVLKYHPFEATEENHLVDTLMAEFSYLSVTLDLPNLDACVQQWIKNEDALSADEDGGDL